MKKPVFPAERPPECLNSWPESIGIETLRLINAACLPAFAGMTYMYHDYRLFLAFEAAQALDLVYCDDRAMYAEHAAFGQGVQEA